MSRRARLAVPGVPWHIIQRGNHRRACFFCEDDYLLYLEILREKATEYACAVHAYVLMTNHIHLLITPEEKDAPALLMKHLSQRYVRHVNKTYRRRGSLWDGRFRSCLTQGGDYVLDCYRYVEQNPVRMRAVSSPGDYRWSSYHENSAALARACFLLTPHPAVRCLGGDAVERRAAYRRLLSRPLEKEKIEDIRMATRGNYVFGSARFQQAISQQLNCRVIPGKSGRPYRDL